MNRNIVTAEDVRNIQRGQIHPVFRVSPPAWTDTASPADAFAAFDAPGQVSRLAVQAGATTGPGGVPIPTEDDYLTKLVKYVPVEVLGAYLFIAGTINSNVTKKSDLAAWLGYTLIAFGILTALYMWRVLSVLRVTQLVMGVIGFGIYVFALGGWFATTTWYQHWYADIALSLFALAVAIIKVQALKPPDQGA